MSYYYFRFVKTDVRHIGILLPVSILTYAALQFSAAYQILSRSEL